MSINIKIDKQAASCKESTEDRDGNAEIRAAGLARLDEVWKERMIRTCIQETGNILDKGDKRSAANPAFRGRAG